MNFSTLQRSLIPAVALAGTVFTTATLPLAMMPSENVVIEFQNEPVFAGRLDELAVPYLGMATVLSVGVGLTSIAVMGWQQSAKKNAQIEAEISTLKQHLHETEAQLDELKFSDKRLAADKLDFFLQDEEGKLAAQTAVNAPQLNTNHQSSNGKQLSNPESPVLRYIVDSYAESSSKNPAIAQFSQPVTSKATRQETKPWQVAASEITPVPSPAQSVEAQPAHLRAMTALPAAQAFNSFKRTSNTPELEPAQTIGDFQDSQDPSAQLGELVDYLKQVMVEVERFKQGSVVSQNA